ncbi:MAG: patatin-like phospholipase family protein [Candidatus Harrisonbacteria bacterium]|nr:patatin-like phospholipase family protein [Candidatus Harrisonbacteria bacterium]
MSSFVWKSEHALERLLLKRDNPQAHPEIRIGLLIPGGAFQVAASVGITTALAVRGLHRALDVVLGVSAGALAGAWMLSPQTLLRGLMALPSEEAQKTIRVKFRPTGIKLKVDVDRFLALLRSPTLGIDPEGIRRAHPEFYVGAICLRVGKFRLINAKTAEPDMETAIVASCAVPGFVDPVFVNGEEYLDGFTDPLPVRRFVEQFGLTDLLIIGNRNPMEPYEEPPVLRRAYRKLPKQIQRAMQVRQRRWKRGEEYLRSQVAEGALHATVLWSRTPLPPFPMLKELEPAIKRVFQEMLVVLQSKLGRVRDDIVADGS